MIFYIKIKKFNLEKYESFTFHLQIGSISSDDCAVTDFGERLAAVEWERRKLKNKLVELQEEKKMKDELLRELYFLKDAANTGMLRYIIVTLTSREHLIFFKLN